MWVSCEDVNSNNSAAAAAAGPWIQGHAAATKLGLDLHVNFLVRT
jgi:hypothetical protein